MTERLKSKITDFVEAKIKDSGKSVPVDFNDATPLITSGLMESLHLLELAILVEEEVGSPLDLTTLDFVREWDTVSGIISFVENYGSAPHA